MKAASELQKRQGAYYTAPQLAEELVAWAVQSRKSRVLDPSFGGGVFLESCVDRLRDLGGSPRKGVYGVEIDHRVHDTVAKRLDNRRPGCSSSHLLRADFFDLGIDDLPSFDAIVGNPPYVRYQLFNGRKRESALSRARESGVTLSEQSSAWAPFVVHACSFLRPGGRAAFVLPSELVSAKYARPVLEYFQRSFKKTTLVRVTGERAFPGLSLDVVFVMAAGFGSEGSGLTLTLVPDFSSLSDLARGTTRVNGVARRKHYDVRAPFVAGLVEPSVRRLMDEICESSSAHRLADVSIVNIGYVTGASDFFHLSDSEVLRHRIPETWLKAAIRRARQLVGIRFTKKDLGSVGRYESKYLLHRPTHFRVVPKTVQDYLSSAGATAAQQAWQCRRREHWWNIPLKETPDLFLSYSAAAGPRLAVNVAKCWASNSLHVAYVRRGYRGRLAEICLSWLSSFTQVSAEFHSHIMGNGLRKLDPTAAGETMLILSDGTREAIDLVAVDRLVREGRIEKAREVIDSHLLIDSLGLCQRDVKRLRRALRALRLARAKRRTPTATL